LTPPDSRSVSEARLTEKTGLSEESGSKNLRVVFALPTARKATIEE
jgi:hypothetical protein